jgi:hypothetical protein
VGFFGTPLYLRIEVRDGDKFEELVARITREYRTGYEHDDSGRAAAQVPLPDYIWNPLFNWIPQEFNLPACFADREIIDVKQLRLDIILRDDINWGGEVGVGLWDGENGITGIIQYRADLFCGETMEQFVQDLVFCAQSLVSRPSAPVGAIPLGAGCHRAPNACLVERTS